MLLLTNCIYCTPFPLSQQVDELVAEHGMFAPDGSDGALRVAAVRAKATTTTDSGGSSGAGAGGGASTGRAAASTEDMALETEVVNEAEAEAEEEAEEEAEQEEQKMSAFSRDDEQANPWQLEELNALEKAFKFFSRSGGGGAVATAAGASAAGTMPSSVAIGTATVGDVGEHPFYPLSTFRAAPTQPTLPFPSPLLVWNSLQASTRASFVGLFIRMCITLKACA